MCIFKKLSHTIYEFKYTLGFDQSARIASLETTYLSNRHKTKLILQLFLACCIMSAVAHACENNDGETEMTNTAIKEIIYRFGDASVPPDYHRSYTITVTADAVRIVVDSYGKILADKMYKITLEQFNAIKKSLLSNKIKNCTLDEEDGCTGGTSERISFVDNKKKIFSGSIYHCGGKDTGNLCGDVTRFANDVKQLIPDLENLLL